MSGEGDYSAGVIRFPHAFALLLAAASVHANGAELTAKQSTGPYVLELRVSPRQQVTETMMLLTVTDAAPLKAAFKPLQ